MKPEQRKVISGSAFPQTLGYSSNVETNTNEKQAKCETKCKQDIFLHISNFRSWSNGNRFAGHQDIAEMWIKQQ